MASWQGSRNPLDDLLDKTGMNGSTVDKVSGIIAAVLLFLIVGLLLGGQ
ncbi:hypothetical protein HNV12_06530 [Methanococcoides sp. SA1]|nr:hypothetical protein [Methanococcoides sp. SA1]